jgi:hypothetical protein
MAQWEMWAMRSQHPERGTYYQHVHESPTWVGLWPGKKSDIVKVLVTEDPEGEYWGWLDEGGSVFNRATPYVRQPGDMPKMVQPTKGMFSMQFLYGPEAEQAAGKGEIVRMTIFEITE